MISQTGQQSSYAGHPLHDALVSLIGYSNLGRKLPRHRLTDVPKRLVGAAGMVCAFPSVIATLLRGDNESECLILRNQLNLSREC